MVRAHVVNTRKAFTLVELLVTIAIIGILLGLLLPNLAAVQATAKAGAQSAILQSFGKGFIDFSTLDTEGRLSTGAYDHDRDGDATKVGWVADIVNGKFGNPTKSLDPVARMKVNEKFCDLSGSVATGSLNAFRWLSSVVNRPSDNAPVTDLTSTRGTSYFGSNQTVWDDGYNSNFATTWHFSRGDNVISASTGDGRFTTNGDSRDGSKCPLDGEGPLSSAVLADPTLVTSADKIALLGAARVRDGSASAFSGSSTPNSAETVNRFIDPTGRKRIVKVGDFSVESFSDGPTASRMITAIDAGVYATTANEQVHEINDIVPNCKAKKIRTSFGQLFGGGYANIIFADGSCRRVNDNNGYGGAQRGDSWIGPYPENPAATTDSGRSFVFDAGAYDEVRDEIYLGRMRSLLQPGGGSAEQ
jgi:prepilin-type N-terminal cleavage/methylation domain-containing protein/prepilin-type processing-associated H-X9-DG protein